MEEIDLREEYEYYMKSIIGDWIAMQAEEPRFLVVWESGIDRYYEGMLFDELYYKYIKIGGEVWEIFDHHQVDDIEDFCKLVKEIDGTIRFHTIFWNGAKCLGEVIETELDNGKNIENI